VSEESYARPFRFLTAEEFRELGPSERMDYMTRAIAELHRRAARRRNIFVDPDSDPETKAQ